MSKLQPRWKIIFTRQAEKMLYHLPKSLLQRIDQAILALAENPRPPNGRPLAGYDNLYRLPIDEWRIAYTVEDERFTVLVLEIALKQQPERYQLEKGLDEALFKEIKGSMEIKTFETFTKSLENTDFIDYEIGSARYDSHMRIKRAYHWSLLNQVIEGKDTELDETPKRVLAQQFTLYKLGSKIEISLSVTNLSKSLSFYHKLGLEKVDSGEKPYPWALVSDGQFSLGLHQREFSSPALSYFDLGNLSERMICLSKLGVRLNPIQYDELLDKAFISGKFETPEGQQVFLVSSASVTWPIKRFSHLRYQQFTELNLRTENVITAVAYWEQLGFKCVTRSNQPYPWAIISDGLIRLNLHQNPKLTKPTISYLAPNMPERLKRLQKRGVKLVAEHKDKKGRKIGAMIESPDEQLFFLFTGEGKS